MLVSYNPYYSAHPVPTMLPAPLALVDELRARLSIFQDIAWTDCTGSTNADLLARARAKTHLVKPWLLGAHLQETGRGRVGRPWQNRVGATLMFSCAFDVHLTATVLPTLSPLAGLAACEALRLLSGQDTASELMTKWPNDVQWRQAKLAGVLVESVNNPGGAETGYTIVMGMGMNLVDHEKLSLVLGREIADWEQIKHASPSAQASIPDIVCAVATAWYYAVRELERDGFSAFRQRYAQVDALSGQTVNVVDKDRVVLTGVADGLDAQARLKIVTPTGVQAVSIGEVSIRRSA